MRKKLANQKQQQVDDEDDRIAKAVAERERKREVSFFLVCLLLFLYCFVFTLLFSALQCTHKSGMCSSRKNPYPRHGRSSEIPRGGGS